MKNVLLTTLFTGLLLSANLSMANTSPLDGKQLPVTPPTEIQAPEVQKNKAEPKVQSTEIIDEMVQSKVETQMINLASAETVENCWAWNACIDRADKNEMGYDSYAFN